MNQRRVRPRFEKTRKTRYSFVRCLLAAGVLLVVTTAGCNLLYNQIEERNGTVEVLVINNTRYRASFTIGSYDAWDLDPPGRVDFEQRRIEAHTTEPVFQIDCKRNIAIGTQALVDRMLETDADDVTGFDLDAFGAQVNFSSAPIDSAAAALPTVGTAEGIEKLLGVDYACNDRLIFTFEEDSTAPGGFRIDFELLHVQEPN